MENYNDEIFGFGNESNEELEQANDFNYDSISGLGESNYENEDLFNTEVDYNKDSNDSVNDFRIEDNTNSISEVNDTSNIQDDYNNYENYSEDYLENVVPTLDDSLISDADVSDDGDASVPLANTEELPSEESENVEQDNEIQEDQINSNEITSIENNSNEDGPEVEEFKPEEENNILENSGEEISLSETPIEELNKLTEYNDDKIETTDINELFNKVSVNVKDASDIFRKNTDLKKKIDTRFDELKRLQSEIENSRKSQIDEVDRYKEEVLEKLTEKKEEIEKRLNLLKETQAKLEKEKQEFEEYKRNEQENINKIQKEVQSAYDDRREELNHIEDVLRKHKDALDEERNQLSLDKIQYESDKNELANNLLKFNDLVNSFTNGVDDIKE